MFPISPALTDVFLPTRKANLVAKMNEETCLCKQKFGKLPEATRVKALKLQQEFREHLKAKLEALRIESGRRGHGRGRPPLAPRLAEVARGEDQALTSALKAEGVSVEPTAVNLKVEPDQLDIASRAGGDAKKARALRQRAIMDQLKAEPPRRTVTGSFRVH